MFFLGKPGLRYAFHVLELQVDFFLETVNMRDIKESE